MLFTATICRGGHSSNDTRTQQDVRWKDLATQQDVVVTRAFLTGQRFSKGARTSQRFLIYQEWKKLTRSSLKGAKNRALKVRKRAEYGFGEYGFEHRTQWVFFPSLSSGERAQWAPFSLSFVWQSERTKFFAELTEFAPILSEAQWGLFSKQYSRNSILPVS